MLRRILGVLIGIGLGLGIVMLGDKAHHALFPPPADINVTNPAEFGAYLRNAPLPALLGLPLIWASAAGLGALAAAMIGRWRLAGWIAGAVLTALTALNLMLIPHPTWMLAVTIVLVPAAAWAGGRLGAK